MAFKAAPWSWPVAALLAMGACAPDAPPEAGPTAAWEPGPRAYRGLPAGTDEGAGTSLLAQYAGRDPISAREAELFQLPFQGKRIAVALLTTAALDRLEDLPLLLTPDARWGLPHRAELQARPVFAGDGGAAFLDAFRAAASRFRGVEPTAETAGEAGSAVYTCPPLVPGAQRVVQSGAEPYWCFYQSDDDLDLLVFKLRVFGGAARVDYVGLFEQRPTGPVATPGDYPPPPLTPPVMMPGGAKPGGGMPRPFPGAAPVQIRGGAPPNAVSRVPAPQGAPVPAG